MSIQRKDKHTIILAEKASAPIRWWLLVQMRNSLCKQINKLKDGSGKKSLKHLQSEVNKRRDEFLKAKRSDSSKSNKFNLIARAQYDYYVAKVKLHDAIYTHKNLRHALNVCNTEIKQFGEHVG